MTAGTPQSFAATSTSSVPVTFASFEASGSFTDRGTEGIAAEDAVRAGEGLHEEVEIGDAPLNERHPGVAEEVLDVHPAGPVARLSMMTTSWFCTKVSARFEPMKPAPPVMMERINNLWWGAGLGPSEWCPVCPGTVLR